MPDLAVDLLKPLWVEWGPRATALGPRFRYYMMGVAGKVEIKSRWTARKR